jgi:hypothetical protein
MTLKTYYENLPKRSIPEFRDRVMAECGLTYTRFYRKLRRDSFSPLEKEKIASITGRSIHRLFPKNIKA